jgi:hypothetical protein
MAIPATDNPQATRRLLVAGVPTTAVVTAAIVVALTGTGNSASHPRVISPPQGGVAHSGPSHYSACPTLAASVQHGLGCRI